MFGTLQYPLAASYSAQMGLDWFSQKLWQLSSSLFWEKQVPVLGELGWAVSTGLPQPHWEEGLENQDSVAPQALKHLHRDFTTGQENLCVPWSPQTPGSAADPQPSWAQELGCSWAMSTPAINKLNWMSEAFLTWHQGTPMGLFGFWENREPGHMQLWATGLPCSRLPWPVPGTLKSCPD